MNKKIIKNIVMFLLMMFFLVACDESDKLVKDARKYIAKKDYRKALELLMTAAKINRSNPNIFYELGNIYYVKEDYSKAVTNYDRAIKYKVKEPAIIYYKLGVSYDKLNDRRRSVINYLKATKIDNTILDAHVGLAKYYVERKFYSKVADECEAILELDPNSSVAYYLMGLAYESRREGKNALLCYARAADKKSKDAQKRMREIVTLQKKALKGDRIAKRTLIRGGFSWVE